ncbi:helix-turn-helix domain-containing protein [Mesorhizobium huakuii]|uniref:Helix-turn-helix transcriptional regulator n=1 Tax=Mesorhizobium huakuii TaxID=28104 RepID=A0A7G6T0S9_9HYPH|nr:helix-turn-helix transcriptional regulator [Mesorhizobium huakuii]QND60361.1 helix-turn-helix transcriptional regulator [Mesorhizobium huakuii]
MTWDLEPDTSKTAIAARLVAVRVARGWTAGGMATALQLSPQRWHNYEQGNTMVPPEVLARLWQLTGVTSDFVLFGRTDALPADLAALLRPALAGAKARAKRA